MPRGAAPPGRGCGGVQIACPAGGGVSVRPPPYPHVPCDSWHRPSPAVTPCGVPSGTASHHGHKSVAVRRGTEPGRSGGRRWGAGDGGGGQGTEKGRGGQRRGGRRQRRGPGLLGTRGSCPAGCRGPPGWQTSLPRDAERGRAWGEGLGFPPGTGKPSPGNSSGQPLKPLFVRLGFLKCLPRRLRTGCLAPAVTPGLRRRDQARLGCRLPAAAGWDGTGWAGAGSQAGSGDARLIFSGGGSPFPPIPSKARAATLVGVPWGPRATPPGDPQHPLPARVCRETKNSGGGGARSPPACFGPRRGEQRDPSLAGRWLPSQPHPPLQTPPAWPCRAVVPRAAGFAAKAAPISCLAQGPGAGGLTSLAPSHRLHRRSRLAGCLGQTPSTPGSGGGSAGEKATSLGRGHRDSKRKRRWLPTPCDGAKTRIPSPEGRRCRFPSIPCWGPSGCGTGSRWGAAGTGGGGLRRVVCRPVPGGGRRELSSASSPRHPGVS